LLTVIQSLFYWRIFKKTILFSGFKNPYKKISETRKSESIQEQHFVAWKIEGRIRKELESEKNRVYAEKPRLKMLIKNSISGLLQLWH
jgi:hypothetical protein